ncbi:MAG: hypothetical protein ACRDY2_01090 [Acidimicrobiales bacterium]
MRMGLAAGLIAGYYLGTKAGEGRHEQLNRAVGYLRESPVAGFAAGVAADKSLALVGLATERARRLVENRMGDLPGTRWSSQSGGS